MAPAKTLQEAKYGYNRCDNCKFFTNKNGAGYCMMFKAPVKSNYVCNEWSSRGNR